MQVKSKDILAPPVYTFRMYDRKRGFVPVKGEAGVLQILGERELDLKDEMEERYGVGQDEDDAKLTDLEGVVRADGGEKEELRVRE